MNMTMTVTLRVTSEKHPDTYVVCLPVVQGERLPETIDRAKAWMLDVLARNALET